MLHRRRITLIGTATATAVGLVAYAWPDRSPAEPAASAPPGTVAAPADTTADTTSDKADSTAVTVAEAAATPAAETASATAAHTTAVAIAPSTTSSTTTTAPPRLSPAGPGGRDAPDPFVLADRSGYWLYTTQVGFLNVPVASSPDLATWSEPTDALPELPSWASWGHTWAPGAIRLGDQYLLYFAARHGALGIQCIGVATASTPAGPFASASAEPLVCQTDQGGSIDPSPFLDADGRAYLLWKADGNAIGIRSTLFGQPLRRDGLALEGEPVALVRSERGWESPLIENPALVAADDRYLLLYSGGWWESAGYATGYADCISPLGPCTKATTAAPLFASGGLEAGPGGGSVVAGPGGRPWLAYHAWTAGNVGYNGGGVRSLHFAAVTVGPSGVTVARAAG